ncbi:MAG: hypothetical protein M1820_005985 [Bogoriella megaspora]|nr:MAG: hypothetical protein M1820_005985 [Bogoriella megaspora]
MPPRISLLSCLRALNGFSAPPSHASSCPALKTSLIVPSRNASTVAQRKRNRDPYAIAQARARKAANLSRQEILRKERAATLGDPIRGVTTPFVESLDTGVGRFLKPMDDGTSAKSQNSEQPRALSSTVRKDESLLNYSLMKNELEASLEHSNLLSAPIPSPHRTEAPNLSENEDEDQELLNHAAKHANATKALARIANLENGSSKDKMRANVARCVATFGRHETEKTLRPRNPAELVIDQSTGLPKQQDRLSETPRAGPDTGSSEVQIAILTAKIKTLADFLQTRGKTDRINQRNLRLLVHRRQKLLQYLRRKERGGPRWQHCIETLGLTEGTWKGEISLPRFGK